MKILNILAILVCTIAMMLNYKNTNILILNGFLAIINGILYIGG